MQAGPFQKLITIFAQAFQKLGIQVSLEKLEELAVTIHRGMTAQARHFHTLEHVFTFVDSNDPIRTLAALYHDIVYYNVDMGFAAHIWELLHPYIRQDGEYFHLAEKLEPDDHLVRLALEVFDMQPGQRIRDTANGLNEFLSALVLIKQVGGIAQDKDVLRMTLCIEATIAFRKPGVNNETHFEAMERRLQDIVRRYDLDLSEQDIVETLQMAVTFANKDIENFAEENPGIFLANTWNLLPETNAALRLPDFYSIGAYRQALQKMANFFISLDPMIVFSQYRGVPSNEEYAQMVRYARANISVAREYLRIKIVSIVILEALAIATGGDAPTSLFLGDLPREGISIKRLEYFLPELENADWVDQSSVLYRLFEEGRANATSFDMKNSPLSLFVYKCLSPAQIEQTLDLAQEMYEGRITADEFLRRAEKRLVAPIAHASALMVFTRRHALTKYANL